MGEEKEIKPPKKKFIIGSTLEKYEPVYSILYTKRRILISFFLR